MVYRLCMEANRTARVFELASISFEYRKKMMGVEGRITKGKIDQLEELWKLTFDIAKEKT